MSEDNKPKGPEVVRMVKQPVVTVIVTSNIGEVLNHFAFGINPGLATWLDKASKIDEPSLTGETPQRPVTRTKSMLTVLGQEAYTVERAIVHDLLILAYPIKPLQDIGEFRKSMPETALYTLVVSY